MLDVGFSEILVIFVLALIVLGPEKLPRVAAQVGKMIGRARAMARQFREQLEEEVNVEASRKTQAAASQTTPKPELAAQPAAALNPAPSEVQSADTAGNSAVTAEQPTAEHVQEPGHVDLSNEPWPYAGPVPPPEVADVFGDMFTPPPAPTAPAPAAKPAAANETPAAPVQWPHDHEIPSPTTETKSATSPGGVASDTHEQGS